MAVRKYLGISPPPSGHFLHGFELQLISHGPLRIAYNPLMFQDPLIVPHPEALKDIETAHHPHATKEQFSIDLNPVLGPRSQRIVNNLRGFSLQPMVNNHLYFSRHLVNLPDFNLHLTVNNLPGSKRPQTTHHYQGLRPHPTSHNNRWDFRTAILQRQDIGPSPWSANSSPGSIMRSPTVLYRRRSRPH